MFAAARFWINPRGMEPDAKSMVCVSLDLWNHRSCIEFLPRSHVGTHARSRFVIQLVEAIEAERGSVVPSLCKGVTHVISTNVAFPEFCILSQSNICTVVVRIVALTRHHRSILIACECVLGCSLIGYSRASTKASRSPCTSAPLLANVASRLVW